MQVSNAFHSNADMRVPDGVQGATERLDTRNPLHYGPAYFDGVGEFLLANAYSDRQGLIGDMLKLVASTGTGARILSDLDAMARQGTHIAIGPRDDVSPQSTHFPFMGVSATVDGRILWDPMHYGGATGTQNPDAAAYQRLIMELANVRNLAAEKAWPGVPALRGKDVEHAFMAELAVRTTPAIAQSGFVPSFPACMHGADPAYMPGDRHGTARFDTLGGLMPAWRNDVDTRNGLVPPLHSPSGRRSRDDLIAVLRTIRRTAIGERLLADLWVFARSRAVPVVDCSGRSPLGVRDDGDKTPVWRVDPSALGNQSLSPDLKDSEAAASGAFRDLLRIHGMLAAKLGMLAQTWDARDLQARFEKELLDHRLQPMAPSPVASSERSLRSPIPVFSHHGHLYGAPAGKSSAKVAKPDNAAVRPIAAADVYVPTRQAPELPPGQPTPGSSAKGAKPVNAAVQPSAVADVYIPTRQAPELPPRARAVEFMDPVAPDPGRHAARRADRSPGAGWLANSLRTFARTFTRSSSQPPAGHALASMPRQGRRNVYVTDPARYKDPVIPS